MNLAALCFLFIGGTTSLYAVENFSGEKEEMVSNIRKSSSLCDQVLQTVQADLEAGFYSLEELRGTLPSTLIKKLEALRDINIVENIEPRKTYLSGEESASDAQLFNELVSKSPLTKLERIQLRNLLEGSINAGYSSEITTNAAKAILAGYNDINDQPIPPIRIQYSHFSEVEQDAELFKDIMEKRFLNRHDRKTLQHLVEGPNNAYYDNNKKEAASRIAKNMNTLQ